MHIYEGKENYIFVSYAHKDNDVVLPIIKALMKDNFRVWYDAGIEAGTEWPENVAEHLCNSNLVLIFLSQNALDSQNCVREIHFAIAERKNILVIYLEELKLSVGMRMQLGLLQAMFYTRHESKEKFIETLLTTKMLEPCKKPKEKKKATRTSAKQASKVEEPIALKRQMKQLLTEQQERNEQSSAPRFVEEDEPSTPTPSFFPRLTKPYVPFPTHLLNYNFPQPIVDEKRVEETKRIILVVFEEFRITGVMFQSVTFGPTVTSYSIQLPLNVSMKNAISLDDAFSIALATYGVTTRPDYDKHCICIEVPNEQRQHPSLGCMLVDDTFTNAEPSRLPFAMGMDMQNNKVYGNISRMAHLLVAGSTASGKSIFLQSLILSLLYKHSPEELSFILIDPKKTEFVAYNNLPHLMSKEVITDCKKAVQALEFAVQEMNRRYNLFAKKEALNLDTYNKRISKTEKLPKIVIIIDELADLMLSSKRTMEDLIQILTQKARAAGIHLVVATQRPSVDVITGTIKANFPTRIAFCVASDVDSRVILDTTGAQKLLGRGDFLYTMPGKTSPVRIQGTYVSYQEIQTAVNFIKENNELADPSNPDEVEPVYIEALRIVIKHNSASISMIQRMCWVGYNKAGAIIEWMEDKGYVSPFEGAKARKVLITKEQFESLYGSL